MVGLFGSPDRESVPDQRGKPPHEGFSEFLPLPFLTIEVGGSRFVKKRVFTTESKCPGGIRPTLTGFCDPRNNNLTIPDLEFNILSKTSLLNQRLGKSNPPGITNANEPSFHSSPPAVVT